MDYQLRPGRTTTSPAPLVRDEIKQCTQTKAFKSVSAHLANYEGSLTASVVVGGKDIARGVVLLDVDANIPKIVSDQ